MLRETVRALAEAKIAPFAAAVDEEARFPQEALDALTAADLHAVHVPEEYGGARDDLSVVVPSGDRPLFAGRPAEQSRTARLALHVGWPLGARCTRQLRRLSAEIRCAAESRKHFGAR